MAATAAGVCQAEAAPVGWDGHRVLATHVTVSCWPKAHRCGTPQVQVQVNRSRSTGSTWMAAKAAAAAPANGQTAWVPAWCRMVLNGWRGPAAG